LNLNLRVLVEAFHRLQSLSVELQEKGIIIDLKDLSEEILNLHLIGREIGYQISHTGLKLGLWTKSYK
jgi:hypothetical protein